MARATQRDSGFQEWLMALHQSVLDRTCWFLGHKWTVSEWKRSPHTCATHWRDHTCSRCGLKESERGYFDALTQPEMFRG